MNTENKKTLRKWMDKKYNSIGDPETFVNQSIGVLEWLKTTMPTTGLFAKKYLTSVDDAIELLESEYNHEDDNE